MSGNLFSTGKMTSDNKIMVMTTQFSLAYSCCSVANRGAMIYDSNISSLGNLMLLDLRQRRLYPLPFERIQLEKYYITSKYCLIKHLKTSERQMNLLFDCCPNFSFEGS